MRIFIILFCFLFCVHPNIKAQTNEQVWLEFMINYPFANLYNLENAFTYSSLLTSPRWRALDYGPNLEYSLSQHVDITFQTVFSYTEQDESNNTFEIRPGAGARFYFTPNKRIETRLLVRLEQRNFKNLNTKEWEHVVRPRARAELLIPINQKSYYTDNQWYGIADAEWLFTTDDVGERFANRFRLRLGLGYRLNYSFRFEFIYMNQLSRHAIGEEYISTDNIFRFRLKHFLRKTKPSKTAADGT